jgi:hypothetical protein
MMTPATTKVVEDRLSYLASIPIDSFDDQPTIENEKQEPKRKSISNVRFNLPSSPKIIPKQQILAKDFLHNFPLLRSLVEEALTLQQYQYDIPISIRNIISNERPQSAVEQRQIILNIIQYDLKQQQIFEQNLLLLIILEDFIRLP